jgi:predicted permease
VQSEIDEELRSHIEMRVDELRAGGLSEEAARREALRRFGDLEATRRYCRGQDRRKEDGVQRALAVEELRQDLRVGLRSLARAPMLAATVVLTVGLGIGATTAMFAAVHAVLLRALPYKDPERLVRIYTDASPNRFPFSVADYLALRDQQTSFDAVAGYASRSMAFTDGVQAERLQGREVSSTYFDLLGIAPALGRAFGDADSRPGSPPAVIVSHAFWQQRLGGRRDAIGRPIRLDGADYTLVGVLPTTTGPLERGQDFFVAAQWSIPPRKGPFFITALGRLARGADRAAAASEMRAINRRLFPLWRASYQDERASWGLMDLKAHVVRDLGNAARVALAAVALVWLIACANASSLLTARVTSRRRELAVRAALGASRGRMLRLLLAESALLALAAAALGVVVASIGIDLLRTAGAAHIPRAREIVLDGPVLGLLGALTVASALVFGLVPAAHGTGGPVNESLQASSRSSTGSARVRRFRRALVASQFAIATPLLVAAGLLLSSLVALQHVDLGFDSRNLLSGAIALPVTQYPEAKDVDTFWEELKRRVEAVPGVSAVAYSDGRPPNNVDNFNNFDLEAFAASPGHDQPVTPWIGVTPEYFRLLGLTLDKGRLLDPRDTDGGSPVVVVDRSWARRFFPNGDAVGQRLHEGGCTTCPWTTVVGVVSDVKYAGLGAPDDGSVYWPLPERQAGRPEPAISRSRFLLVRTQTDPAALIPSVRDAVRGLDPTLPLSSVATIDELATREFEMPRLLSLLVGAFASIALLLSTVGIYGVMAYYVEQHAKDIGIRLALGGSPADVLRLVVGQAMRIVASGVGVGLLTALAVSRLMSGLLFGVGPADAATFGGTALLLILVALMGCGVPAGRAVAVQPAAVLRNE